MNQRETDPSWYAFQVAPTCPPSTSLNVRGGVAHCGKVDFGQDWTGKAFTVPDLTLALGDAVKTLIAFEHLNWYRYYVVLLAIPANTVQPAATEWQLRLTCWGVTAGEYGKSVEYEAAVGAEAALMSYLGNGWDCDGDDGDPFPWSFGDSSYSPPTGMPLCGVILRNNGLSLSEFLPIDPVNRGRSYLWPTNLRPQWMMI